MKILLLLLVMVPCLCFSQTGKISGNAFYKYNDFVGNRPDAGCTAYLFLNNTFIEKTKSDVSGNFYFDGLKTGSYDLIIVSNATNASYQESFNKTSMIAGFIGLKENKEIKDSVYILLENLKTIDQIEERTDNANKKARKEAATFNEELKQKKEKANADFVAYLQKYLIDVKDENDLSKKRFYRLHYFQKRKCLYSRRSRK